MARSFGFERDPYEISMKAEGASSCYCRSAARDTLIIEDSLSFERRLPKGPNVERFTWREIASSEGVRGPSGDATTQSSATSQPVASRHHGRRWERLL